MQIRGRFDIVLPMRAVWSTVRFVLVFLFLASYGARTVDYGPSVPPPTASPGIYFGESLALSDFDGDNLIDRARLGGEGARKSIEIYLSRTGKLSVLQFETASPGHGSLFAEDVNNDGDVDLVWTDLLHPDDVIIWLNTGLGRFERICPHEYAHTFILGDRNLRTSDGYNPEAATGPVPSFSLDQAISTVATESERMGPGRHQPAQRKVSSLLQQSLTARGPPTSLI